MLTIESHVTANGTSTLVVRIPDTAPDVLAQVAGDTVADGPDTLHTTVWPADTPPADQRREARLLIEHALAQAAAAEPEPAPLATPGDEL
ncbi:MAG: hypothetical protein M0P31_13740 [Solirubrobacteraceae bacterium]|nr:hypothetical protein [Solirubrobacteraceae bacterium]